MLVKTNSKAIKLVQWENGIMTLTFHHNNVEYQYRVPKNVAEYIVGNNKWGIGERFNEIKESLQACIIR